MWEQFYTTLCKIRLPQQKALEGSSWQVCEKLLWRISRFKLLSRLMREVERTSDWRSVTSSLAWPRPPSLQICECHYLRYLAYISSSWPTIPFPPAFCCFCAAATKEYQRCGRKRSKNQNMFEAVFEFFCPKITRTTILFNVLEQH